MKPKLDWKTMLFLITGLGSVMVLGYLPEQSDFWSIFPAYFIFFGVYAWFFSSLIFPKKEVFVPDFNLKFWLVWAIFLRFLLLFSLPNLSDDFYRFVWDGRLWNQGINPFDHLPGYFLQPGNQVPGLDQALFDQLNSPEYFTIYPPVCQFFFAVSAWVFPESLAGATFFLKVVIFGFEIGTLFLLPRLLEQVGKDKNLALLYALNPLIIIELCGNLHFEGVMIFFLLASIYFLKKGQIFYSAGLFAFSISTKLLPLIFLPFLPKRLGLKASVWFFSTLSIALLVLFSPLFSHAFLQNFGQSLDLYFRKFEFNASFYYLLRWLGFQWKGYNLIHLIGPLLALCTFFLVLLSAGMEKTNRLKSSNFGAPFLFAISVYLLFTTTVHPWYICLPVVLCLFSNYRLSIIWSGLIVLSYSAYAQNPFRENYFLIALEYLLVAAFFIWEVRSLKIPFKSN